MSERRLRRLHRLATIVIGLQLLVWTATGVAFSWFDFAVVRGEADRPAPSTLRAGEARISVEEAIARAGAHAVVAVELRALGARAVYQLTLAGDGARPILVDAIDGRVRPPISAAEAAELGRAAHRASPEVRDVTWLSAPSDAPDVELPAWRVRLADARRTEVFIAPATGRVLAFRNSSWRWFDRLWSLHVLGYINRDQPAHWAMRIAASLALLAVLSGAALFVATRRRRS